MTRTRFMVIAGEASGDLLAAELVAQLRQKLASRQACATPEAQPLRASLEPEVFGAGGAAMKAAGVKIEFDLTAHAMVGLVELKKYLQFARLFRQLLRVAVERQPHAIICVDFSGFNRRFGKAVRKHILRHGGPFSNWQPKLVQYVSPQVWASRPGRAFKMARDFDLLLSIFPFEKEWYAKRVPQFHVEFVGHPLVDRHSRNSPPGSAQSRGTMVALLPGSRAGELNRHLPVMRDAVRRMQSRMDFRWRMVLPNESLAEAARAQFDGIPGGEICVGLLADTLSQAHMTIASTGTVTLECAWFGVPTIAIYKTSWSTYQVGKRLINVRFLAMPNILANEEVFPELIQDDATGERIAEVALKLLQNTTQRESIRAKLKTVVAGLGARGAIDRAAEGTIQLMGL